MQYQLTFEDDVTEAGDGTEYPTVLCFTRISFKVRITHYHILNRKPSCYLTNQVFTVELHTVADLELLVYELGYPIAVTSDNTLKVLNGWQ